MGNIFRIQCAVGNLVLRCWDSTVKQTTYTRKLEENFKDLKGAVDKLRGRSSDLIGDVHLAEEQRLTGLNEVEVWLSQAEDIINEAEALIKDGPNQIDKLCLAGCFSTSCKSSYKFGKEVAKKCKEIATLQNQGVFEKIARFRTAPQVEALPVERVVGLESTFEEVWRCLTEENVGIIGLHGLGGVGKTTLLTQINNNFNAATIDDLDVVIIVEVSKDCKVEEVQDKIGKKIGLLGDQSWKNKTSDEKRTDIFEVLSGKKFVILLDGLWERVELMKVGIPIPSQNGSKLVFTTRKLSVCGAMEAQKTIEMKCLGPVEAWNLFEEKVGRDTLASHPEIPALAQIVVSECNGLPLALVTIGQAMAFKRNHQSWRVAIGKLQQSAHEEMVPVYERLKFSYDKLDEKEKSCLLYCSLFSAGYKILKAHLIFYCILEGVLGEFSDPKAAYTEGYGIIDSLINASLLEEQEGKEHVKMHDVVHDMALWIGSMGQAEAQNIRRTLVKAGTYQTEAPEIGKWAGVERISLMQNMIQRLVGTPECSALKTLLLNQNGLKEIDDGFFHSMSNLRVLNLAGNENLTRLPADISNLSALEYLNLSQTGIRELPTYLSSLTRLKHLILIRSNLRSIPQQLISSFPRLELVRMYTDPKYCPSVESEPNNVLASGNQGLLEELEGLQYLDNVSMEIKNGVAFERISSSPKLKGCIQEIFLVMFPESEILYLADMEQLEDLNFSYCQSSEIKIQASSIGGNTCFNMLRHVIMFQCHLVMDITWLVHVPTLRRLRVMACDGMESLISEEKLTEVNEVVEIPNPFLLLEELCLKMLPELKSIYWDALPFPHLTRIEVSDCPNLKKLPLNSDSGNKENFVILGNQQWWEALQWENEATRDAFLPCLVLQRA